MKANKQNGFTLVELLIVIAIIGIIAAIAIPQFNSYREKSVRASIVADCGALFRGFTVYYLEYDYYPLKDEFQLGPVNTFKPLSDKAALDMDLGLELNVARLQKQMQGGKADTYDSPDDLGWNQEFYLTLSWIKDSSLRFVVAEANDVLDADGNLVDGGNWLSGVFMADNKGKLIYR